MVEHVRDVLRFRRHRGQPQSEHAAGEQVHSHRQLHPDPAHRDRLHRKHIQRRGVEHHVLAGPGGTEPTEHTGRTIGHRPPSLCTAERMPSLRQHLQTPVSSGFTGQRHRSRAEACLQLADNRVDDNSHGRRGCLDIVVQHLKTRRVPPRVHADCISAANAGVGQPGDPRCPEARDPAVERAHRDIQFLRLGR